MVNIFCQCHLEPTDIYTRCVNHINQTVLCIMKPNSVNKAVGVRCFRTATCHTMLAVIVGLLLLGVSATRANAWGITWSDDFTGVNNQPWSGNWSYQTGGGNANHELEIYVNSWANCHVISDGTGTDGQALQFEAQTD